MDHTPGYSDLQHAAQEVEAVRSVILTKGNVRRPSLYRNDVLAALRECTIFHFAGYGCSNKSNPSHSGLMLEDGVLTVENLFALNLQESNHFLAYLSACGTGQVKNDEFLDEALHLMSVCRSLGLQHVIGSLWEVDDNSCVDMAAIVYDWISKAEMSNESISTGLHHACRAMRAKWLEQRLSQETPQSTQSSDRVLDRQVSTCVDTIETSQARDAVMIKDLPLFWVPYVRYGT